VTTPDLAAIATWNAENEAARREYSRDGLAASRGTALAEATAWLRAHRISRTTYLDMVADIRRRYGRTTQ
jgi:hypothetical protein